MFFIYSCFSSENVSGIDDQSSGDSEFSLEESMLVEYKVYVYLFMSYKKLYSFSGV